MVMVEFNEFGEYLPPMILFPGKCIRHIGLASFPEAIYAATPNGWKDSSTFVHFLQAVTDFLEKKQISTPVLLFVDGHSTHLTHQAAQYCHDHQIILYCLLPNATHILQAADVGLFSPMKSWHAAVKDWQMKNVGHAMTKKVFPSVFKKTWDRVTNFPNAANGFWRSGLFPFNPDAIDKSKLHPSRMIVEEKESEIPESSEEQEKENENPGALI